MVWLLGYWVAALPGCGVSRLRGLAVLRRAAINANLANEHRETAQPRDPATKALLVLLDDFGVDHIILRIGGRRTGRLTRSRC